MKRTVPILAVGVAALLRTALDVPANVARWAVLACALAFAFEWVRFSWRWRSRSLRDVAPLVPDPPDCGAVYALTAGLVPGLHYECHLRQGHDGDHQAYISDASWSAK